MTAVNPFVMGLNSGTSADGVSAVLARFVGRRIEIKKFLTDPYPAELTRLIRMGGALSAGEVSELNMEIGRAFAKTAVHLLKKSHVKPADVTGIGSHGQTVYHGPGDRIPNTLQIGDPSVIAQAAGLPVVSGFRQGDIAAGGQGAPLIPFFDRYFFGHGKPRALLNIGGMANVAVVGRDVHQPLAFDTGPGNYLMDQTLQDLSAGKIGFDAGGRIAKKGALAMERIPRMAEHPYFSKKPPKSTGAETFGREFLMRHFQDRWHPDDLNDLLATLNYFTCITIQEGFRSFIFPKFKISDIVVSGGGVFNKTMIKKLECLFAPIPVVSIETLGIPPLAKEPLAFAFFAWRRLHNQVNHWPQSTGAKKACVLGSVTLP